MLAAQLLHPLDGGAQAVLLRLNAALHFGDGFGIAGKFRIDRFEGFGRIRDFGTERFERVRRRGAKPDAVLLQLPRSLVQVGESLLGKPRSPATGFGCAAVAGDAFGQFLPTRLHLACIALQAGHPLRSALLAAFRLGERRCCGFDLLDQLCQACLVLRHLRLPARFLAGDGVEVCGKAGAAPPGVLRRLLQPSDVGAEPVVARLHFGQGIDALLMPLLGGLHPAFDAEACRAGGFDLGVERDEGFIAAGQALVRGIESQQAELGQLAAFLGLEVAIALGIACLASQSVELPPEFLAQVGDARQVFAGVGEPVVSLAPTLAVLGDAGRFLQKGSQFVGLGVRQLADHALFDDGVAARAEAGAEKDAADVAAAAPAAVKVIGGLAVARQFPAHRDFAIGRVFAADAGVFVIEGEFHRG